MTTQSNQMNSAPRDSTMEAHSYQWRTWPDWVNVVIGAYVILAPIWTVGASTGWYVVLGILAVLAGIWALATASSSAPEWSQIVVGVVLFLSPWIGGFAGAAAAAWTAWIAGVALVVLAATAMGMGRKRT